MARSLFKDDGNTLPSSAPKPLEKSVNYNTPNWKIGSGSPLNASKDLRPSSAPKELNKEGSVGSVNTNGRMKETKFG